MKRSLSILTVAVISALALTGCPSNSSDNKAPVPTVGGQIYTYPQYPQESCNVAPAESGTYTCTQTINGIILNTNVISFVSLQDLCTKLNDNYSQINKDVARNQIVASQTRYQLAQQRCVNVGGTGTGTIEGAKTFNCQIQARRGNDTYQSGMQQQTIYKYGKPEFTLKAPVYVVKQGCRLGGFLCGSYDYWDNLANVKVSYEAAFIGSQDSMDKIIMSTEVDGSTVEVSGFAGSETKIEITPKDRNETTLIVSCVSPDAKVRAQLPSTEFYQCSGEETTNGRASSINYPPNRMADVIAQGIRITNSAYVKGSGDSMKLALNNKTLSVKSNLTSTTTIKIDKDNYSLDVMCEPK